MTLRFYSLSVCMSVIVAGMSLTSCVEEGYDFNDISYEVTVGADGLTIPLGVIEKVTLDSLLSGEINQLEKDENGFYTVRYDGDFGYTSDAVSVDPIDDMIPPLDPYTFMLTDLPNLTTGHLLTGESNEINLVCDIQRSIDVPAEVKKIDYLNVSTLYGDEVEVALNVTVTQSPVSTILLKDARIILPSFIDAVHPNLTSEGVIELGDVLIAGTGTSNVGKMGIRGLKNLTLEANKVEVDEQLKFTGSAYVAAGATVSSTDPSVVIVPEITLPAMQVTRCEGSFDVDFGLDDEPLTIDLDDLSEMLDDTDFEINLAGPVLAVDFVNSLAMPLTGTMKVKAYDLKNQVAGEVSIDGVTLAAADGQPVSTRILFTDDPSYTLDGYTLHTVPNLADLVRVVPSKIEAVVDVAPDNTQSHSFEFGRQYDFDVNYDIRLPLKFEANSQIRYNTTIDIKNAFSNVADFNATSESVSVIADIESTLPLDLTLSAIFLDADGNPTPEVVADIDGGIAGYDAATDGGESKKSSVVIGVNVQDGDLTHLSKVASLALEISAAVTGQNQGLKPEQFLKATLKVRVDNGISVDIDKL